MEGFENSVPKSDCALNRFQLPQISQVILSVLLRVMWRAPIHKQRRNDREKPI